MAATSNVQTAFLGISSWRYWAYHIMQPIARLPVRGSWHVSQWVKTVIGNRYIKTSYLEHKVWICPNHAMGRRIARGELYEPEAIKIIQVFIRAGFSFIDIGANIGLHTLAAAIAKNKPEQRFHAFEPEPKVFQVLRKNCELNHLDFVTVHCVALGQREENLTLYVSTTTNQGNHSLFPRSGNSEAIDCSVIALDQVFVNHWSAPIFIKLDVEGAEPLVVKGGLSWLCQLENLAIMCEASSENLQRSGYSIEDLGGLLAQIGLGTLFLIDEATKTIRRISRITDFDDGLVNILAVKGSEATRICNELSQPVTARVA
jgi:FkbM family methyltransferase